jgi:hypothetical protein
MYVDDNRLVAGDNFARPRQRVTERLALALRPK